MSRPRVGRVEKHGKGWRFQLYVDGQRIRQSFPKREEAQQALDEMLANIERNHAAELARRLGSLTVADVVSIYMERRRPHLEPSTLQRYDGVVRKYVLPRIGGLAALHVAQTPFVLQDFLDAVPWGSARKALEVLNPAFRMAVDNGLVPSNPVDKIRRPRPPARRRKKDIPTADEVEKIVIAAYEDGVWWGYFVELIATLGLRRSEACALRWEDFEFPGPDDKHGVVHIRRAVGKRDGGIYIKAPKSGQPRDLLVHRSLFDGLEYFRDRTGWLFPGRPVHPRRRPDEITHDSSAGRLILWLDRNGGKVVDASGRAGADARRAIGTNSSTLSQVTKALLRTGHIERDAHARRTFRLALTALGRQAVAELRATDEPEPMPWHPDTAGHRFQEMLDRLEIRTPDGRGYGLHSLRHFRATHLYNQTKDWVQLARYLGHISPAITMELYANNVVEDTQRAMADAAVRF